MTCREPDAVRDLGGGADLVVAPGREELAERAVRDRASLDTAALRLLRTYLNADFAETRGTFDLIEIEVRPAGDVGAGDVVVSYGFVGREDPEVEGYTVFEVGFRDHGDTRPLWPFRFGVGFR